MTQALGGREVVLTNDCKTKQLGQKGPPRAQFMGVQDLYCMKEHHLVPLLRTANVSQIAIEPFASRIQHTVQDVVWC
jgi:hypothetical protein